MPAEQVLASHHEANITGLSATRGSTAMSTTEYGARVIKTGTVYMHGPLQSVQAFIDEYSDIAPLELISQERDSVTGLSGPWTTVLTQTIS